MLDEETKEKLDQPLDPNRIKTQDKGYGPVDYLEAHDVINRANEIFGYDGWSGRVVELEEVYSDSKNGKYQAIYKCIYEVEVGDRTAQDVGTGSSQMSSMSSVVDNAIKTAVSDAIKRCLHNWGDQFGLCLYDKSTDSKKSSKRRGSSNETGADRRTNNGQDSIEEMTIEDVKQALNEKRNSWQESAFADDPSEGQVQKIGIFWDDYVDGNKQDRLRFFSEVTDRKIESGNDLLKGEASAIIETFTNHTKPFVEMANKFCSDGTEEMFDEGGQ